MSRFLSDLMKVDIPGRSIAEPAFGLDPRSWVPPSSLIGAMPCRSVFSRTGWIRRFLSPAELGLAVDLPLDCLAALEEHLSSDAAFSSHLIAVAPLLRCCNQLLLFFGTNQMSLQAPQRRDLQGLSRCSLRMSRRLRLLKMSFAWPRLEQPRVTMQRPMFPCGMLRLCCLRYRMSAGMACPNQLPIGRWQRVLSFQSGMSLSLMACGT